MKTGFVNIFGLPNAGKSTLLNALVGEKLAIVSPKVQTTRHRIKAILNDEAYQIIFSDTPGIIEPQYKLQERMMQAVKSSLEDADLALFVVDVTADFAESHKVFESLRLRVPAIVILNKSDKLRDAATLEKVTQFFKSQSYCRKVISLSALKKKGMEGLLPAILEYLPEGEPYYDTEDLTDMPTRFFVGEIIREKVFQLFEQEIPYHTAVLVQDFKEKPGLISIRADVIVQRESQKMILLGGKGAMIKKLGTLARLDIEAFLGSKVYLELFVKVRPNWRGNDTHLKEYGYN
jgi:GTP-binding protein Era